MKNNKIIIIACVLFLMIMIFSFYFLFQDSGGTIEDPVANERVEEKLPSNPEPLPIEKPQEKIEVPIVEIKSIQEKVNLPIRSVAKEEVNENLDKTAIESLVNPISEADFYHPLYDRLIVRSRAKAFFVLYDAKGKLLEPNIVNKVRIWRQIRDDLWFEDNAVFNHEKSVIECDGFGRQGLEPGRYSVWIDGGGYGALEFNFQINKDEEYKSSYQMPYYAKTIAVQFVDLEDKNIEYIRSLPVFKAQENEDPALKFNSKKALVLSMPSAEIKKNNQQKANDSRQSTLKAYQEALANESKMKLLKSDSVYQTNLGKIYITGFSDQIGEIKYENASENFATPFSYKSNFNEIESVKVIIKKPAQLKTTTEIIIIESNQNNESIGLSVNKSSNIKKPELPTAIDHKTKGFIYHLKKSKFPLLLEIQNSIGISETIKDDGFVFQRIFNQTDIEDSIKVRLVDKKIFKSPWEPITLEKGSLIYRVGEFPLQKLQVKFKLSPTFFEMAKDFAEVSSSDSSFALEYSHTHLYFDSFFSDDLSLLNENTSGLNFNIISKIDHFKAITHNAQFSNRFLPKGFIYKTEADAIYQVPLQINTSNIIKSYDKTVECAPLENVLILRAIDLSVSGLPWVEASLIKIEDIRTALEVKNKMSDSVAYDYLKTLTDKDLNLKSEMEKSQLVSKKLNQIFPLKEQLNYFLANGTWYNPNAKSFSDSAGYMILKSNELIPGKAYVLYLWCKSKDELTPDKEIIFKAEEGITDLGAIRFY